MADDNNAARQDPDAGAAPRQVDFTTLVLSIRQGTLEQLQLCSDDGPPQEPDLPGARVQIDLLEVLQEKTRGNLQEDEDKLLATVLYELRMAWLQVRDGNGATPG